MRFRHAKFALRVILILSLLLATRQLFDVIEAKADVTGGDYLAELDGAIERQQMDSSITTLANTTAATSPTMTIGGESACPTLYSSEHQRFGFNFDLGPQKLLSEYDYLQLNAGWYHDYARRQEPTQGIQHYQMIRSGIDVTTLGSTVGPIVDANLGVVWFLGNEPDKIDGQDNLTPAEYAEFYHDVYMFLKQRDPTAQIAIAGVVQATPVRLAYLDRVLSEYQSRYGQPLPVDIMTVHGFILCEVCLWGAGLPPGMADQEALGRNYEVNDHIDIEIFKTQIVAMRQWMADRGYQNKPLIVNEYGVLMPEYFAGFGYAEVRDFMLDTFDFFLTATDPQIGYAADDGRLVQEFAWFSLNAAPYDPETERGFNGALFVHDTGELSRWGADFAQYTAPLVQQSDVAIERVSVAPSLVITNTSPSNGTTRLPDTEIPEVGITVDLANIGQIPAYGTTVQLWLGEANSGTLLETATIPGAISADAGLNRVSLSFTWRPATLNLGGYDLNVKVIVDACNPERTLNNQRAAARLTVIEQADLKEIYIPVRQ